MGVGRLHDAGFGALQPFGASRCAHIQLVELVCEIYAHPKARLEAITSKPLLLAGVGRLTEHAGQTRLLVSLTHAAGDKIKAMIGCIHKGFEHVRATAPQLPKLERWRVLVRYIIEKILASKPKNPSLISVSLAFCKVETG